MTKIRESIIIAEIVDENTTFSIHEICTQCNIPIEFLEQLNEHGFFELAQMQVTEAQINLKALKRIEAAFHLYRDLEINLPGVSMILELKDELDLLRSQLSLLQKHLEFN